MKKTEAIKFTLISSIWITILIMIYRIVRDQINGYPFILYKMIGAIVFGFSLSFVIVYSNLFILRYVHRKYRGPEMFEQRLGFKFIYTSISASFITTIFINTSYLLVKNYITATLSNLLFEGIIITLIFNLIFLLIMEGKYMFEKWKKSLVEIEQIKRQSIESQFAALKNQITPHFLFNSMNALSSLIKTDTDKALEFVNRFSKIYRYVLDVADKVVIETSSELEFLNSYYFLQKIRFAENIQISVKVDADKLNYFILPLSIQFLVENAIKHNEISSKFPLQIEITNDDKYLIVKNNLNPKEIMEDSTGIGLKNIKERYGHFTDILPEFYIENSEYIAKIPLLKEE